MVDLNEKYRKEKRFIITGIEYKDIKCTYNNAWERTNWYFEDHSIRLVKKPSGDELSTIDMRYEGRSVKVRTDERVSPDEEYLDMLDSTCLFKSIVKPKLPTLEGLVTYIEETHVYIGSVSVISFITTEAESTYDEGFKLPLLLTLGDNIEIEELGEMSMRNVIKMMLKRKVGNEQ